jgi:hypothetical protein
MKENKPQEIPVLKVSEKEKAGRGEGVDSLTVLPI